MEWTVAIGVDTHREVHVAVALDALGVRLDSREIESTQRRLRAAALLGAGARRACVRDRGCGQLGRGACPLPRASSGRRVRVRAARAARGAGGQERSHRRRTRRASLARWRAPEPSAQGTVGARTCACSCSNARRDAGSGTAALNQLSAVRRHLPRAGARAYGSALGGAARPGGGSAATAPEGRDRVLRRLGRRVERLSKELAETEQRPRRARR
jgi:hypothetical protein